MEFLFLKYTAAGCFYKLYKFMLSIKVGKFERKKKKDRMSFSVLIFVNLQK